jgi:peptidoglycan/xylan/chitin deacetylase (PgdA/CDA1 family)
MSRDKFFNGATSMKTFLLILSLFSLALVACSTNHTVHDHAQREIASVPAFEAKYDSEFSAILNSVDPVTEYLKLFDSVTHLYILAERQIAKFDQELDSAYRSAQSGNEASTPLYGKSYAKLTAIQSHEEILKDKCAYLYFKVLEYSAHPAPFFSLKDFNQDEAAYKKSVLEYTLHREIALKLRHAANLRVSLKLIHDEISRDPNALSDDEKIVLVSLGELRQAMASTAFQYYAELKKNGTKLSSEATLFQGIDPDKPFTSSFSSHDDFEKFAGNPNFKKLVISRAASIELDPDLEADLKQDAQDNYQYLKKHGKETYRSPQSLGPNLYPSMDTHGNITGNSFPSGTWALTYDDGPHSEYTLENVANLEKPEHRFRATFFWLAKNVELYPNIIESVQSHGLPHENHSWTHPQLSKMNETQLHHEIDEAQATESKIYNEQGGNTDTRVQNGIDLSPQFFRAPYGDGANKPMVRTHIVNNKMIHVFWNVDSLDWQDHNPDTILQRTIKQIALQKHGVILFHDIHPQSVVASDKLMTWFREQMKTQKLRLVTIPDVVEELNGGKSAGEYSTPGQTSGN